MQTVGIHWDQPHFRAAYLRSNSRGIEILGLDSGVKLLYKADFRGKIITGLSGKDLLIRHFSLKIEKRRHLEKALEFQSETTSHLPPGELLSAALLYQNKQEKTTEAIYITALKEKIQAHLNFYSSLEIAPDRVGAAPQALVHYALWKYPGLQKGFFIDLGSSECLCLWIESGKLKKSFSFSGGIEELLEALWEDRKKTLLQKEVEGVARQIDVLQLKSHLNPHLQQKLAEKRQELAKAIYAFSKQTSSCPIFFTGRTDAFIHLREYIIESIQEIVIAEKKLPPPIEEHKYAISIGLALEEMAPDDQSIQFLQKEFFPRKNWKKAGWLTALLFFFSLLGSGALLSWSEYTCRQQEEMIIQSIENLLSRYDPMLKTSLIQEGRSASSILHSWMKSLEDSDKQPSYALTVPKVSEVLDWLSHHPLLKTFAEQGDPIEWKNINYRLVHFPKIGSLKEEYKAQVDLEFSTKNSTNARKFHEALLKSDDYIDTKQTIGWEASSQGYKATFFLKQKASL
jgi:type IV pilus assembly protein PilM